MKVVFRMVKDGMQRSYSIWLVSWRRCEELRSVKHLSSLRNFRAKSENCIKHSNCFCNPFRYHHQILEDDIWRICLLEADIAPKSICLFTDSHLHLCSSIHRQSTTRLYWLNWKRCTTWCNRQRPNSKKRKILSKFRHFIPQSVCSVATTFQNVNLNPSAIINKKDIATWDSNRKRCLHDTEENLKIYELSWEKFDETCLYPNGTLIYGDWDLDFDSSSKAPVSRFAEPRLSLDLTIIVGWRANLACDEEKLRVRQRL